tara:strand:+ start:5551 stop:6273 length:723 start_codon:yes stop_codon:yes gene_type:complete
MKTIEIGGILYKKATEVAKDLGYTTDYIGQLCRSGKVEAEFVGRSWYVNPDSLKEHKFARHRSNKEKSRKAVEEYKKAQAVHIHTKDLTPKTYSYEADDGELVPTLTKPKIAQEEHFHTKNSIGNVSVRKRHQKGKNIIRVSTISRPRQPAIQTANHMPQNRSYKQGELPATSSHTSKESGTAQTAFNRFLRITSLIFVITVTAVIAWASVSVTVTIKSDGNSYVKSTNLNLPMTQFRGK